MGEVLLAGGLILGITVLCIVGTAAISVFADGLAVVCRDTGAGDPTGAVGRIR